MGDDKKAVVEMKFCKDCVSYHGRMKAYGPYHECRHAQSRDLVEGDRVTECSAMRATLCGAEGKFFAPTKEKAKT